MPVKKTVGDLGFKAVNRALELMGSHGYSREGKMEKAAQGYQDYPDLGWRSPSLPYGVVQILFRNQDHLRSKMLEGCSSDR